MRSTGLRLLTTTTAAAILFAGIVLGGCEEAEESQLQPTTAPSQPQFQPLKLTSQPSTLPAPPPDWKPATLPSALDAGARASTQASATTLRADPLATPESAVRHFLEICSDKEMAEIEMVNAILVEPPPEEELVPILNRLRIRLLKGATWEIVETRVHGAAAAVIYRSTYRGREEPGSLLLLQQRERWKIILGELTPRRYTPGEKGDVVSVGQWAQERMAELSAAATQRAATQRAATQLTSRPAAAAAAPPSSPSSPSSPAPP